MAWSPTEVAAAYHLATESVALLHWFVDES